MEYYRHVVANRFLGVALLPQSSGVTWHAFSKQGTDSTKTCKQEDTIPCVCFTPIPCSYTSLPLDGAARNLFFLFVHTDTQDHTIYHVWVHLFFLPPIPEKR